MTALQALWDACGENLPVLSIGLPFFQHSILLYVPTGGEESEAVDAITELKRTEWFERAA